MPDSVCLSCAEEIPEGECPECPNSKRPCGHHCDCSWVQDECCWCGAIFGDVDDPSFGRPRPVLPERALGEDGG